jgi:hypothetical protein
MSHSLTRRERNGDVTAVCRDWYDSGYTTTAIARGWEQAEYPIGCNIKKNLLHQESWYQIEPAKRSQDSDDYDAIDKKPAAQEREKRGRPQFLSVLLCHACKESYRDQTEKQPYGI